ncbi:hypothetical protein [Aurantiacibacter luteus]|uniref:SMODS and SLOG-associating 2TM effector domain-containing protein n=1 Tax=Aurantiacibacter luteus TaxID=1581420 RepID=A0A0G9MVI7_9SPHN|nr:hypothetical protein [Aurantiacibacter luteus]KLE34715.1 hypothetical protein AAW00_11195 [Aurantiacibacter luteus]
MPAPPPPPVPQLSLGLISHDDGYPAKVASCEAVSAALQAILTRIDALVGADPAQVAPTRMHTLLASEIDRVAARTALASGWELVAPLPYGRRLNRAIAAAPRSPADARALLANTAPEDTDVEARAKEIAALEARARLFEIADQDESLAALFTAMLEEPGDPVRARAFALQHAEQVALAQRVMIEQSDLVIGFENGTTLDRMGGTSHAIAPALALGTPVLLIAPACPERWRVVATPEALAHLTYSESQQAAALKTVVRHALHPAGGEAGHGGDALARERWTGRSSPMWLGYRLIDRAFGPDYKAEGWKNSGPLLLTYEKPEDIAVGRGAAVLAASRALPGGDKSLVDQIEHEVLPDFAWADGISIWLSDAYRSGMIASFLLAALAVIVGISYQPLGYENEKWVFAGMELFLLAQIVFFLKAGRRQRWHQRWFDTRRVAEYLRHAPILLPLGIARPPGRWPRGSAVAWPEYHARHRLRRLGLPEVRISRAYLRAALGTLLEPHALAQRDYHRAKAVRLARVHHRLDHIAARFFVCAVVSVSIYLTIAALAAIGVLPADLPYRVAKVFTFLGVAFPTLGASLAAIRYFGDFERFAAISEVTAEKLDALAGRIRLLLNGPADAVDYRGVADLARAVDEITVAEIESWQAVFGGKHIALPA